MCYQRSGGDPVPGCVGGESVSSSTDYCTLPALNDIGNGLSAGSYELCQVRIESPGNLEILRVCTSEILMSYILLPFLHPFDIMANRAIVTLIPTVLARMFVTRGTDTTPSQDVMVLVRYRR